MKMFYLACPYSSDDEVSDRISKFSQIDGRLMRAGYHTVSPLYKYLIFENGVMMPSDWQYWAEYSKSLMALCDAVVVIEMDGWKTSKGVTAEIEEAQRLAKPVFRLRPYWDESKLLHLEQPYGQTIHIEEIHPVAWELPFG